MDGSLDKYSLNEHLIRRVPEGWLITTPVLWPIGGRWNPLRNPLHNDLRLPLLPLYVRAAGHPIVGRPP